MALPEGHTCLLRVECPAANLCKWQLIFSQVTRIPIRTEASSIEREHPLCSVLNNANIGRAKH